MAGRRARLPVSANRDKNTRDFVKAAGVYALKTANRSLVSFR
jgi:hypothetical protein